MQTGSHFAFVPLSFGELGETPNTGNPFIEVALTLEGGPCDGEKITWRGYLTEKSVTYTVGALVKAFGWTGDPGRLVCSPGHDGRCIVVVGEETTDKGKTFLKAQYINPIGSVTPDSRKKSMAQELRERCLTAARESGAPLPAGNPRSDAERLKHPTTGLANDDGSEADEIPF